VETCSFLSLFQAYLESFYKFCKALGGTTADAMCPILEVGLEAPTGTPITLCLACLPALRAILFSIPVQPDLGEHCLHVTLGRLGCLILAVC